MLAMEKNCFYNRQRFIEIPLIKLNFRDFIHKFLFGAPKKLGAFFYPKFRSLLQKRVASFFLSNSCVRTMSCNNNHIII